MYQFRVIEIPGKSNKGPDAISRIPVNIQYSYQATEVAEIEPCILASINTFTEWFENGEITIEQIREEAARDNTYQDLVYTIQNSFPENKKDVPDNLKTFWSLRSNLYAINNLVYVDGRILIPLKLRTAITEHLHIGHQCVTSMKANARQRFFWPGMSAQIQNKRNQCRRCNDIAPSNRREPSTQTTHPEYPFQKTVTDIFHMAGQTYVVYADRFSGWTEVASTKHDAKSATICNILRRYFINFGVPEELSSDGGPQYDCFEMKSFLKKWGVKQRLSSAYFPQSNGRAEAAVKAMKRILTTNISPSGSLDTDEVGMALLLNRNTPPPDIGASPAELLFGRSINDHLPSQNQIRKEWSELADAREKASMKRQFHINKNQRDNPLKPLRTGDIVSIQNQHGNHPLRWDNTGTIIEALPNKQYRILIDGSRRTTLRNRRFIRRIDRNTRNHLQGDIMETLQNQTTPFPKASPEIKLPPSPIETNPTSPPKQTIPHTTTCSPRR